MIKYHLGWLVLLSFSFSQFAHAEDSLFFKIHHHYVSPRALGMGDAFVAVANDYTAMFYNPAGLARREDSQTNLSIGVAAAPSILALQKDIDASSKTQGTDTQKAEATAKVLESAYGNNYGLRANLFEGIHVRPNWGIAVVPMDLSVDIGVHKQLGPAITTYVMGDTTIAYSYAKDVKWIQNARTSVGITGKLIHRVSLDKSYIALDLATNPKLFQTSDLKEGIGMDADLGFLVTPEFPNQGLFSLLKLARPTFGLVIRNIGEVPFSKSKMVNKDATQAPDKNYRVIDVGSRWEYPSIWLFSGRGVLDIRDMMHPSFSWRKGLHLGFEFDWKVTNWWKGQWRVGLNQMYYTAGMSAQITPFKLDLVTYGEDVGTFNAPRENRVYMAKLNLDF